VTTTDAPWPFEQADSLQHHISTLSERLEIEIGDEDVDAALATTDRISSKLRELRKELTAIPITKDVRDPEEGEA
jgi:hypothetical protein